MIGELDKLSDDALAVLVEAEGYAIARRAEGEWTIGGGGDREAMLRIEGDMVCVESILPTRAEAPLCRRAIGEYLIRANKSLSPVLGEFRENAVAVVAQTEANLAEAELIGLLAAIRIAVHRILPEVQVLGASEELAEAYLANLNENNVENTAEQGGAPSLCVGEKGGA